MPANHDVVHFPKESGQIERYLHDLSAAPSLSDEELAAALSRVRRGDMAAHEQVALAHLKMVVRIACRYTGYGLPLADMISEGNIGLLRAVELYDPVFGTPFHVYASVWVKQRIHRAITAQAKSVRIPIWRSQRLRKLDRLHDSINTELGRDATLSELASRLGMSEDDLSRISQDRTRVESVDANEATLRTIEHLQDDRNLHPAEGMGRDELRTEMLACLDDLDDTELQVISLKFGLLQREPESYREMAPRFGRSREWIRKIGDGALAKVRDSLRRVGQLPRHLVEVQRQKAEARLTRMKKSAVSMSVPNAVLMNWMEALIPIL